MKALLIKCLMLLCVRNVTGGTVWPSEVVQSVVRGVVTKYCADCVYFIQWPHSEGECSCSEVVTCCYISRFRCAYCDVS